MENHGGEIIFRGGGHLGSGSAISVGSKGTLDLGDNFGATARLKLVCYDKITFAENVLFGWDCMVMDTDFHSLKKLSGGHSKGHAPISIGRDNWFGNGCRLLKRTSTPDYIVVQGGTWLSGPVDAPNYSVVGSDSKVVVKAQGVWRQVGDDSIDN